MSELEFLSPDRAESAGGFAPVLRSPLERALRDAPPGIDDESLTGKLDVRGDVAALAVDGVTLALLSPRRALVFCAYAETAALRARLRESYDVVDVTGALAGVRVRGEQVLRRLTDLDLDRLPAAGAVASIPAVVLRDGDEFRIFCAQELGHHLVTVVIDTQAGLLP